MTLFQRFDVVSFRSSQYPVIGLPPSVSGSSQFIVIVSIVMLDRVGFSHWPGIAIKKDAIYCHNRVKLS